jgi:hypothetical protein
VLPSSVAEALPLPVMIGCCASLNGIADKYTWFLSAAATPDAIPTTTLSPTINTAR